MNYRDLVGAYSRYLGFGFLHTFFSSIGQTFLIALFVPSLRQEFSLSSTAMGSYYGMVTLLSAFTLLFSGPLIDRMNLRFYSVGVGLLLATGCLLLVLSSSLALAIVGLFLVRHGGQGLMAHTAFTSMARYFSLARGKALGITGLGIACGEAVLPVLIAVLIQSLGWRATYLLLAASCVFVFLPLSLFLINRRDDIQHPGASQSVATEEREGDELNWGRKEMLTNSYFWLMLPLLLLPPFLGTGYFFFQAEIALSKSWSPTSFASCFLAYGSFAALSSFSSGPLVDRWGGKRLLPFTLLPMLLGLWILIEASSLWGGYLFMSFLGLSFGVAGNVRNAMWAEVYGRLHLGSIKSFASMLSVCCAALAPPLGGWLFDRGFRMESVLWGSVGLSVIATLLALCARPPRVLPRAQ